MYEWLSGGSAERAFYEQKITRGKLMKENLWELNKSRCGSRRKSSPRKFESIGASSNALEGGEWDLGKLNNFKYPARVRIELFPAHPLAWTATQEPLPPSGAIQSAIPPQ